MFLFTLSQGKIVSYALELDQIGLLQQLGWNFTPPGRRESKGAFCVAPFLQIHCVELPIQAAGAGVGRFMSEDYG